MHSLSREYTKLKNIFCLCNMPKLCLLMNLSKDSTAVNVLKNLLKAYITNLLHIEACIVFVCTGSNNLARYTIFKL